MSNQELDNKTIFAVVAVLVAFSGLGFMGYKSYEQKKVDEVIARRDFQISREAGIPASMDADENATPKEREQARVFALEQMEAANKSQPQNAAPTLTN